MGWEVRGRVPREDAGTQDGRFNKWNVALKKHAMVIRNPNTTVKSVA